LITACWLINFLPGWLTNGLVEIAGQFIELIISTFPNFYKQKTLEKRSFRRPNLESDLKYAENWLFGLWNNKLLQLRPGIIPIDGNDQTHIKIHIHSDSSISSDEVKHLHNNWSLWYIQALFKQFLRFWSVNYLLICPFLLIFSFR
jgi:hypothetical protein